MIAAALVSSAALAQEIPPPIDAQPPGDTGTKPEEAPPVCIDDPPAQYGYVQSRVPQDPANFADLGTALPSVSRCDDCATYVTLPFAFEFFGYTYTGAWVGSNGMINFATYDWTYSNYTPYVQYKVAVMPAWDDWDTRCGGAVYYKALSDRVVVTWHAMHYPCWYYGGYAMFQAVLFADGNIRYNYSSNATWTDAHVAMATADMVNPIGTMIAIEGPPASYSVNINNIDSFLFTPDIDHTPPVTTASFDGVPGNPPWWVSDVTVTLTAVDPELPHPSGVRSTEYTLDGATWIAYGGPFTISTEGGTTLCYRSTDNRGNEESMQCTTLLIDKTGPVIAISTPSEGAEYLLRQPVTAAWSASDATSGLATAAGTVASGEPVDTASPGAKTFTVTATDVAGNTSTATASYFVRYAFGGFLPPVAAGGNGLFRLGSTIPVKFQLQDYFGALVSTATARLSLGAPGGTEIVEATASGNANAGNLFRFDLVEQQYVYNLSTKPLSTGTWTLRASLDDGSVRTAPVNLK
jgi:hypothetical protein